jgi:zinc transporter 1/2/3
MLPSGMESLTDPCLSDDWNAYSAYAGLFAMLAILAMQLIEFIAHHQLHRIPIKDNGVPQSSLPTDEHHVEVGHSHGVSLLQESHNHKVSTYLLEFGIALHSVLIGVALGTTDGSSFVVLL